MKKQYIFTEAYSYNYWVIQYIDGKYENGKIVSLYELDGYLSALESMGYERAYYEKEILARIKNLEEELRTAKERYQKEQGYFLNLSQKEAERYEEITNFDEDDC